MLPLTYLLWYDLNHDHNDDYDGDDGININDADDDGNEMYVVLLQG